MDHIALVWGKMNIYWHGLIMSMAMLLSFATAWGFGVKQLKIKSDQLLNTVLLVLPLGLLGARVLYLVCSHEEFHSTREYFMLSDGGYALYGAIFGALSGAVLMKLTNRDYPLRRICDSMAVGASVGIIPGRMAAYFSFDNVGMVLNDPKLHKYPWAAKNTLTGEWVFATFRFEAFFAALISVFLIIMLLRIYHQHTQIQGKDGDITLLFLMLHGASQGIFDSMHMDALKLPGNSFVRVQQIIGAACIVGTMAVFVIRSIKKNGLKKYHIAMSLCCVGCITLAVIMELDRISDTNYFRNHGVIFAAMFCAAVNGIIMYHTTLEKPKKSLDIR